MQSRSKRSSEVALLSHSSALTSSSDSSTRVTRARVESSSSSQSIVQQKLEAARSKQLSSSFFSIKPSAPAKRPSSAKLSLSKKKQQSKARLAKMRQQRHDAVADDDAAAEDQQKQSAAEASKQSLIPVAAGSPAHWEPIDLAHGNSTLVLLSKDNPKHKTELAQVHESWIATEGAGAIVSVCRVQNLALHQQYESFKQKHAQTHEEIRCYHGTSGTPPSTIYESSTGFDPKFGCAEPGHLWFAEDASYSSGEYVHAVTEAHLPFVSQTDVDELDYADDDFESGFSYRANGSCVQIMQTRICVDTEESTMFTNEQAGVHTITQSQQAVPTHLITFVWLRRRRSIQLVCSFPDDSRTPENRSLAWPLATRLRES